MLFRRCLHRLCMSPRPPTAVAVVSNPPVMGKWQRFALFGLLVTGILPAIHAFNSTELVAEIAALPEEDCMSTQQLADAVRAAAWNATINGVSRSAVMITTCDIKCMKALMEPFLAAIENSRDGDFSRHLIVVGNGIAAYLYCDHLRHKHNHHCVLDRFCLPPGAPHESNMTGVISLGKPLYFFSLVQKVTWAAEVSKLGLSVMWTDMDIVYFANPLPFMFTAAPDADMMIQTEYWDNANVFVGDACKFVKPWAGCEGNQHKKNMSAPCCGMSINGGMWLINPTPRGINFLESWLALLFENNIVQGKAWDGSAILDQYLLDAMVYNKLTDMYASPRLYKWDAQAQRYINYANISHGQDAVIYRISAQRTQSKCFGPCGFLGDNTGYNWYLNGTQLVCVMPKKYADRMISIHMNCDSVLESKRTGMMWFRDWTIDEARYWKETHVDAGAVSRTVNPEW